jgi:hypothetical protein
VVFEIAKNRGLFINRPTGKYLLAARGRFSNGCTDCMEKTSSPNRLPHLLAVVFFVALLATPLVLKRRAANSASDGGAPRTSASAALARYGFALQEVASESGLDFQHEAPKLDPKLEPIMPQVASMGAAVSVGDFDRDGWDDLYVCNSGENSKNRLYRNMRNGKFEDVAEKMGVASLNSRETGVSMGAVWGDCDNDGFEDLLVYKWGEPQLWLNKAGKKFVRAQKTGLPAWVNANSAVWMDYDADGRLDLFLGGYYSEKLNLWKLADTRIMPESFEYAQNGGRKYLLRNVATPGGVRFEDVTAQVGLNSRRWALAASAADVSGSGHPDLFIANDYGVAELWQNQGGKKFRDVGRVSGCRAAPKSGMNVAWGDVFNSGQLCAYVTNISEEGILLQGNNLWVPRGKVPTARRATPTCAAKRGGAGRLELRRSVRRPQQRRQSRFVPHQRLHLGLERKLLVRLLEGRGRQHADHRRRSQLAADERPQPVRLPGQARLAFGRRGPLQRGRAERWCH